MRCECLFFFFTKPHLRLSSVHLHFKPLWQVYRNQSAGRIIRGMRSSSVAYSICSKRRSEWAVSAPTCTRCLPVAVEQWQTARACFLPLSSPVFCKITVLLLWRDGKEEDPFPMVSFMSKFGCGLVFYCHNAPWNHCAFCRDANPASLAKWDVSNFVTLRAGGPA